MSKDDQSGQLSRRALLGGAAGLVAAPLGVLGAQAFPSLRSPIDFSEFPFCRTSSEAAPALTGAPRKLRLSWNANAVCLVTVPVAIDHGFFKKQNLDIELVNFAGSTDQLLEAIATGKSDGGVGMALRWLKPLEQGFDVKITAATHGGCMRVLAPSKSGIAGLNDLKGKTIGVADLGGADKNFFSIELAKRGIDPNTDVEWRVFPGNLLRLAAEKGETHAFLSGDPVAYLWLKDGSFKEVASNLDGEYKERSCCILGLRGSLVRDEPLVARAVTQAILDAAMFTAQNPELAAKAFSPYAPKDATFDDLRSLVGYHTHHHHPTGNVLKGELKAYADDLKLVSVFKKTTDTTKFAERIYADVLSI
jgi:NitT/TauT family transport system substrate-binding protein